MFKNGQKVWDKAGFEYTYKQKLEQFKKENPKDWVYNSNNEQLIALYQATIKELKWVLED